MSIEPHAELPGDMKNSASCDKTICIWYFPSFSKLIEDTRERFKDRQLTPDEKRKYYLEKFANS